MHKPFYIGSYRNDGLSDPHRGWIVGKFKEDFPRKNDAVEIKYWEYKAGPVEHDLKESAIIECTFILKGKARASIDGKEIIISEGDYIVIAPGTPSNIPLEVLEDIIGLTIKAPSDPSAKKVLTGS